MSRAGDVEQRSQDRLAKPWTMRAGLAFRALKQVQFAPAVGRALR